MNFFYVYKTGFLYLIKIIEEFLGNFSNLFNVEKLGGGGDVSNFEKNGKILELGVVKN